MREGIPKIMAIDDAALLSAEPRFQLKRYFSIASGLLMLAVVIPLAYSYFRSEVNEHTALAGVRNEVLARTYANVLWPRFGEFLLRKDIGTPVRRNHDLTAALDAGIREMSRGVPVIKIKAYNLDGLAVYSSVIDEIGEDKSQNSGFISARNGKQANELTHRGRMSVTEGEILNVDVVSSYIPIYLADSDRVVAVFELYSNVTDTVARIEVVTIRLVGVLIAVFFLLYLSLLAIVARADAILTRQYAALKDNQDRLRSKTRDLENEIQDRQKIERALRLSEDVAASANRAKSDFLSSMSHELRTPMNSILGFTQLLETEPGAPLSERQQRFVNQIMKAGNHLLELINQVLDLSRIESGKLPMSIETISISMAISEALPMVLHLSQQHSVTLDDLKHCNLQVLADYGRLKQVILNLLSNAIKYNRAQGHVSIDAVRCGDMVKISITDTGLGIEAEKLPELFKPFSRLGHDAGEIEGTGIGLTLSKRIVEAMSGTIGVESSPGVGSTFWFTLPLGNPSEVADPEVVDECASDRQVGSDEVAKTAPGKCVLYVEDNPANVMLMEEILHRIPSLRMVSTHTAELGLALAEQIKPSLILMDIHLPGMSGLEALARLRANPETAAIPVIALTANAMASDIEHGLRAGFDGYETKPVEVESITRIVMSVLARGAHDDV